MRWMYGIDSYQAGGDGLEGRALVHLDVWDGVGEVVGDAGLLELASSLHMAYPSTDAVR